MPNEITDTSPVSAASAATAQTPAAADPTPANSTNPTAQTDPYTSIGAEPGPGGAAPVKWGRMLFQSPCVRRLAASPVQMRPCRP